MEKEQRSKKDKRSKVCKKNGAPGKRSFLGGGGTMEREEFFVLKKTTESGICPDEVVITNEFSV